MRSCPIVGRGLGSTFMVRLSLIDCPHAALGESGGAPDDGSAPLAGRRILVADDNRDAADSLCQPLGARGADAYAAYDGAAALQALQAVASADAAPPDAIVLDIGMPGMDGCEVARRLRHDPRTAGVTLVALSGWVQSIGRQRARGCGFDHHPTEPADLESLLARLAPRPGA